MSHHTINKRRNKEKCIVHIENESYFRTITVIQKIVWRHEMAQICFPVFPFICIVTFVLQSDG